MERLPNKQETVSELSHQVLEHPTEEEIQKIIALDKRIFPTMPVDEEELRETLASDGVQVVLSSPNQEMIGYIISLPHDEAYEFLKDIDPELKNEEKGIYIESIGILEEHRSAQNLRSLWETFKNKSKEKGFKKVTAHVRVSQGLSDVFQKRLHAKKLRQIENWADFNEPFDYIELDLEEGDNS